jgi:hypothetical protein
MKKINKKIYLDQLPKISKNIDCRKSIGYKVRFIYGDIEGEFEIVDYKTNINCLFIKYLNREPFKINTGDFQKCAFGKMLGKITNKFKIEIGKNFKDDNRDLIIIDREYRKDKKGKNYKFYKYKCNNCTNPYKEYNKFSHYGYEVLGCIQ